MFTEINGVSINMFSVSSFKKKDEIRENSDGTSTTVYVILYSLANGQTVREEFDIVSDRDTRYDALKENFGVK